MAGVLGGSQFPTGRWPDQIAYSRQLDTYIWSLGAVKQIQALDHIHVVNYDQDGAPPYTMELIMPVMENLPAGSRMYFFYVSRCHDGDQLKFSPVALSGNTVNGVLGTYTFTLDGSKQLFVCIGVNGNYIIHPINLAISPVIPSSDIYLRGVNFTTALTTDSNIATQPYATSDLFMWPTTAYYPAPTAIGDNSLIAAFTPNVSIFSNVYFGFQCTVAGYWSVNYHMNFTSTWATSSGSLIGSNLMVVNSTGVTLKYNIYGGQSQLGAASGTVAGHLGDEVKIPLAVGDIVMLGAAFDFAGDYTDSSITGANVTFIYLGPYPVLPPAGPSLMALRSASSSSSSSSDVASNEIVMGSENDTPKKRKELHKKLIDEQQQSDQKRKQQQLEFASSFSSNPPPPSPSSQQPSFTLADVENIVRKVMSSQQQAAQQSVPQAEVLSVSSSSSSSVAPPSRKRSRASLAEEKEPA